MKKILTDVRLPLGRPEEELRRIAEKKCRMRLPYVRILKKSLDARDKDNIRYIYSLEVSDRPQREERQPLSRLPRSLCPERPVLVVGSGPAGLFCALRLIDRGIPVELVERGPSVEERAEKIGTFSRGGALDTEGNVQFGEGGAGTFSDGKLNTARTRLLTGKFWKLSFPSVRPKKFSGSTSRTSAATTCRKSSSPCGNIS